MIIFVPSNKGTIINWPNLSKFTLSAYYEFNQFFKKFMFIIQVPEEIACCSLIVIYYLVVHSVLSK